MWNIGEEVIMVLKSRVEEIKDKVTPYAIDLPKRKGINATYKYSQIKAHGSGSDKDYGLEFTFYVDEEDTGNIIEATMRLFMCDFLAPRTMDFIGTFDEYQDPKEKIDLVIYKRILWFIYKCITIANDSDQLRDHDKVKGNKVIFGLMHYRGTVDWMEYDD